MRSSKIVLTANPVYRGFAWNFKSHRPRATQAHRADEGQEDAAGRPRRDLDHGGGPVAAARVPERRARHHESWKGRSRRTCSTATSSRPSSRGKGVQLSRIIDPEISYLYWNMQDPVVGGLSKEKIALRRAMAMAYPVDEDIKVARNGQAVEAKYPIPPGVVGHQPQWRAVDPLRSRRRERAARQVRLQEGRRRLPHAARRQAAGRQAQLAAGHGRRASSTSSSRSRWTRSACASSSTRTSSPSS